MNKLAIYLQDRAILAIGGSDARKLLQDLVSCDLDRLTPHCAIYGTLLTPQGKFLHDFFLLDSGDHLLLDTHSACAEDLVRRLTMYRLRADVSFDDVSVDWDVVALLSDPEQKADQLGAVNSLANGSSYIDPRTAKMGRRALLQPSNSKAYLEQAGYSIGTQSDYDARRIGLGIVDGHDDLDFEKTLLLEANIDQLGGVDFDKGCYIGQEQTARMKHRATLRNRFYPVTFRGDVPPSGTPVMVRDVAVGSVRSVSGNKAIARLRIESVESGSSLTAAGKGLEIGELDL